MRQKKESFVIKSPIRGRVNAYSSADTILSVSSPNSILFIPVAWKYHPLINKGMQVELAEVSEETISYSVTMISSDIQQFNGEQVLTLIAVADHENSGLPDNLWTTCTLNLGNVSIWEFLKWKLFLR